MAIVSARDKSMTRTISIVIPVLNEEKFIGNCLASVLSFHLPSGWELFEILVMDGGSCDGTRDVALSANQKDSRIKLVPNPGKIQSVGLNIAIKLAVGDFIVRLDAHTIYPVNYLQNCINAWLETRADNIGGLVVTMPGGKSYGAQVVQALTTHKFGVGDSGFRTGGYGGKVDTVPFGFFHRDIFVKVGLFDERLVRAQDYELNRRISMAGGIVWLDSRIQASYFNQPSLWNFLKKQVIREAPYNAYMWYLAPYAFTWRHSITSFFSVGIIAGLLLWSWEPAREMYLFVLGLYAVLGMFASIQQGIRYRELRHVVVLPLCFFAYHFMHGAGVLIGLLALCARRAPVQEVKEPWPNARQNFAWPPPDGKSWALSGVEIKEQ